MYADGFSVSLSFSQFLSPIHQHQPPLQTPPQLELRNVSKTYRSIPAVEQVSFLLRPGEVLGYLGPNGSGKSTTVKMIIGLIEPPRGTVLFDGRDIREDLPAFRAQLGYVPEEAHVYTHLSGMEYLQLTGRLRNMPEALAIPGVALGILVLAINMVGDGIRDVTAPAGRS